MKDFEEGPEDLIKLRKDEVDYYESNIATYKKILKQLPYEWPDNLLELRDTEDYHSAASTILHLEDVELFSLLVFRDDLEARIRSEVFELAKAKIILKTLELQEE